MLIYSYKRGLLRMTNFNIYELLSILLLATFIQARRLTGYQSGVIIPKLFKIVVRNNEILLEKIASEEFDKKSLLDYLQNNANLEYRVDNILNRNSERSDGVKKRWIKRIVPHDKKTPNVLFDRVSGFFFKPLVRLHKTKKIQLEDTSEIPKLSKIQDELNALRAKVDLEKIRAHIKPIKTYTERAKHVIDHMREVDAIIGEIGLPYLSEKLHHILIEHEQKIGPEVELLHRKILHYLTLDESLRGGAPKIEDVVVSLNHSALVLFGELKDLEDEPEEKPEPLFPHVPIWNKWTYDQSLYQAVCPEGQVKIGTVCSSAPSEHRRRNYLNKNK